MSFKDVTCLLAVTSVITAISAIITLFKKDTLNIIGSNDIELDKVLNYNGDSRLIINNKTSKLSVDKDGYFLIGNNDKLDITKSIFVDSKNVFYTVKQYNR